LRPKEWRERRQAWLICYAPRCIFWARPCDFARPWPAGLLGAFGCSGAIAALPAPAQASPASAPSSEAMDRGQLALSSRSKFATSGAPMPLVLCRNMLAGDTTTSSFQLAAGKAYPNSILTPPRSRKGGRGLTGLRRLFMTRGCWAKGGATVGACSMRTCDAASMNIWALQHNGSIRPTPKYGPPRPCTNLRAGQIQSRRRVSPC
jgi:hypothetical protein